MLDDAYSGVVGGHAICMMDAWKDVLNGRCFWQFSASCSILGTL